MKKTVAKRLALGVSVMAIALAGCSGSHERSVNDRVRNDGYRVDASLVRFGERESIRAGGTQLSDSVYVGAKPVPLGSGAALPARLETLNAVTISSNDPLTLNQIAARLTESTGIQHSVSLDSTGSLSNTQGAVTTLDASGQPITTAPSNYVSSGAAASSGSDLTMQPRLRGPLSKVLDQIASTFDVDWTYEGNRVLFRAFVTKQYQISSLPSATTATSSIGGGSGSSGGSSTMSTSTQSASDVWADVRAAIAGLVGPGGNISMSPSTGMITVTARAADQARVASYIRDLNGIVGQQVSFDVNVLTVNLNEESSQGIDLNAVFGRGVGGQGRTSVSGEAGAVNFGIVRGDFSLDAVVRALSNQGRVSVTTRAATNTSNNRITPVNITDTTSYVSGYECDSATDNAPQTCRPEVDTIETGFQIQLMPRVMNNREIMVHFSLRLSELTALLTAPGENQQQLPQISETSMEQQPVLGNGQTLVLAGFERTRAEMSSSGYDRRTPGIGGTVENARSRVATVILITPRLIDRQRVAGN